MTPNRPSKPEFLWTATGVCLEEVNGERALGLPPLADPSQATPADMPAAAAYGDGLLPLLERKLVGLKQLGIPVCDPLSGEEGTIREALRHYEETVEAFRLANDAAHRGDASAFVRNWIRGRQ